MRIPFDAASQSGDHREVFALCYVAKTMHQKSLSTTTRIPGRPMTLYLDENGHAIKPKLAKTDPYLVKEEKLVFCIPKEETCHRCGYEYSKGERECGKCGRTEWGGEKATERESRRNVVAKTYLDQAKALIGTQPDRLAQWNNLQGWAAISAMFQEIDRRLDPDLIPDAPEKMAKVAARKNVERAKEREPDMRHLFELVSLNRLVKLPPLPARIR